MKIVQSHFLTESTLKYTANKENQKAEKKEEYQPKTPIIMGGDFNLKIKENAIKIITEGEIKDATLIEKYPYLPKIPKTGKSFESIYHNDHCDSVYLDSLDHLFFTPRSLRCHSLLGVPHLSKGSHFDFSSDHLSIMAQFDFCNVDIKH